MRLKRYWKLWKKLSCNDVFRNTMTEYQRNSKIFDTFPGIGDKILAHWELIYLSGDVDIKHDLHCFKQILQELIECNKEFVGKVYQLSNTDKIKLHTQWRNVLIDKTTNLKKLRTSRPAILYLPSIIQTFLKLNQGKPFVWASAEQVTAETKTFLLGMTDAPMTNGIPTHSGASRFVNVFKFYAVNDPSVDGVLQWQYMQFWGIILRLCDSICDSSKQLKHAIHQWNKFFSKWAYLVEQVLTRWPDNDIFENN